jgi:hypothetical protein
VNMKKEKWEICLLAGNATIHHGTKGNEWCNGKIPPVDSNFRRMSSSGMLCHVALVRTDISEERIAPIIRVTRITEVGLLAVTSNRSLLRRNTQYIVFLCSVLQLLDTDNIVPNSLILVTLMMGAIRFSEMSVLTTVTWHKITEDCLLHSHCRENLKSYLTSEV